nr:MAG TPA: hypothetical protein [Caudoviricetes sp.]
MPEIVLTAHNFTFKRGFPAVNTVFKPLTLNFLTVIQFRQTGLCHIRKFCRNREKNFRCGIHWSSTSSTSSASSSSMVQP